MAKIVLPPVTGGNNIQRMNDNFNLIANALNDGALWRDNPEGEPNEMLNDLDMNGQRVYNLPSPLLGHEPARLQDVQNLGATLLNALAWGSVENTGNAVLDGSHGISSVTSTGAGVVRVVLNSPSSILIPIASVRGNLARFIACDIVNTQTIDVTTRNISGTAIDAPFYIMIIGL